MMIPYKIYKQSPNLCGPASLKTVFDYLGFRKSEKEWTQLSNASQIDGVDPQNLVDAVLKVGYKAELLVNCSIDKLKELANEGAFLIVDFWLEDEGHYSPVVDVRENEIVIADVSSGKNITWSLEKFILNWFDFLNYPPKNKEDLLLRSAIVIKTKN